MNSFNLLIVTLVIIIFSVTMAGNSYAQTSLTPQSSQPAQVYLQIEIRNSDGQLVAYVEPTVLYMYYPDLFNTYVDSKLNKTLITVDGKNYQQIQFEESGTFTVTHTMAQYEMVYSTNGKNVALLTMIHDGYPEIPGDKVSALWTIIKPVSG